MISKNDNLRVDSVLLVNGGSCEDCKGFQNLENGRWRDLGSAHLWEVCVSAF